MAVKRKSKTVAMWLAIFGGAIGLQWFYLGKIFMALTYIFLLVKLSSVTVFGMPLVIFLSLLNAIRFFQMDPERFDRKYNRRWLRAEKKRRTERRDKPDTQWKEKTKKSRRKTQKRSRNNSNRIKKQLKQAYVSFREMDLKTSEENFLKVLEEVPNHAEAAYHLACIYSVWEDKDKAFKYLEQAVKNGLKNTERIAKEDKLAFLRIQEEYQDFEKNGYLRTKKQSLPPKEDTFVTQLMQLKKLREQGKIEELVYREELEKLKRKYGNT